MPTFNYTAASKDGKTVHGTIEAVNKDAVVSSIEHQNMQALVVKLETKQNSGDKRKRNKKIKSKDLVVFTRQLSTMISAGVPLSRSLATMQNQTENKFFKVVIGGVAKDVQSGQPLADGFSKFPSIFSDVYVNMVRAGEAGGILDEILKRLASQVEQEASMRHKIKGAMTYPIAILTITIVAFF